MTSIQQNNCAELVGWVIIKDTNSPDNKKILPGSGYYCRLEHKAK